MSSSLIITHWFLFSLSLLDQSSWTSLLSSSLSPGMLTLEGSMNGKLKLPKSLLLYQCDLIRAVLLSIFKVFFSSPRLTGTSLIETDPPGKIFFDLWSWNIFSCGLWNIFQPNKVSKFSPCCSPQLKVLVKFNPVTFWAIKLSTNMLAMKPRIWEHAWRRECDINLTFIRQVMFV